ncbi:MAG: NAD(P)/FAD-dependent oxidoreductase [Halioglobus sp.]
MNATIRPLMGSVTTVVIGAGQAGLAMSACLSERDIAHVVLERGEVANSWRKERWDSLRLLTPRWQSRLPGHRYQGNDPDGYMDMPELVGFMTDYASSIRAPVYKGVNVTEVCAGDQGYRVVTDQGEWRCRTLVLATGAYNIPVVPELAAGLPAHLATHTTQNYRNPGQLSEGGVMVVGASATGLQLAREIQRSGREVTLAVGEHVRMPRNYRGKDILWWMDRIGLMDERYDEVEDLNRARRLPSAQLAGGDEDLDLNSLTAQGVKLVGRLSGVRDGVAQFSGSLNNVCRLADLKMKRLLTGVDQWAQDSAMVAGSSEIEQMQATRMDENPRLQMDLNSGEIDTVVWATGFRPDYSWLRVPVLDAKGRLRHDGGVVDAPGLYAMGLPFMRRRKSGFLDGVADDARDISDHLSAYVRRRPARKQRCVTGAARWVTG